MNHESQYDDDYIDIRALVTRLWRQRWWVISIAFLMTAGFTIAAFLMTPMYRATTVMVAATSEQGTGGLGSALGQLGGLASLAGINIGGGGSQVDESLAVLKSREFTEAFIRDNDLLPLLYPRKWDSKARVWKDEQPTLAQASRLFDKKVRTVSQDKKTGLITVSVQWRDPDAAAQWVTELVARLNAETRKRAIARTTASVGYLQKELAGTAEVDTRAAIGRLMESQINQRMLANVTQEYAFRVVDKAMPPDRDDVASPNKPLLVIIGAFVGAILGVAFALVADSLRKKTSRTP